MKSPIFASLAEALQRAPPQARHLRRRRGDGRRVHAARGARALLIEAAEAGLTLVNGLHELASDDPEIAAAAARGKARIVDLRRPRPVRELRFWTGAIAGVRAPRLALLGTDCAVGKRTTARLLVQACRDGRAARPRWSTPARPAGCRAGASGSSSTPPPTTSWPASWRGPWWPATSRRARTSSSSRGNRPYATPRDLAGRSCWSRPGRGPSSCSTPRAAPASRDTTGWAVPSLLEELELVRLYGAQVLAITLNGDNVTAEALAGGEAASDRAAGAAGDRTAFRRRDTAFTAAPALPAGSRRRKAWVGAPPTRLSHAR